MNSHPPVEWSKFLAWLVAPTSTQRWEIATQIFKETSPSDFAVFQFWYERSPFGSVEFVLRKFWLSISKLLPVWEWLPQWYKTQRRNYYQDRHLMTSLALLRESTPPSESNNSAQEDVPLMQGE